MDPNITLAELRKLVKTQSEKWADTGSITGPADDMAELFADLDEWLSRGGFLPIAWQKLRGS